MKLNDSTILRIKVPANLYESIKAQLTIKEGKQNFGTKDMKAVKVKDSSSGDKPKKTAAPKASKPAAPKKAEGAKEAPKDGHKKMGLDELKALAEMLKGQIAEMEKTEEGKVEEYHEPENIYDDEIEKEPKDKHVKKEGKEKIEEYSNRLYQWYQVGEDQNEGECWRVDDEGNMIEQVSDEYCQRGRERR